ncbi:MAG: 4Fe-4S dicluster domain-containing protein [Candidatus Acidiferrales bacterium]
MSEIISQSALRALAAEWIAGGKRVGGPARVKPDLVLYRVLRSGDDLLLEGFQRPSNSIKDFLFPKVEKLYGYKIRGNSIELVENDSPEPAQVVIAARPCDAAALPILDHVFNWDFKDEFYNRRRAATTVVTLACSAHDENCFCTSVGLDPGSDRGSDAILFELGSGQYEVRCATEKGRALFDGRMEKSDRTGKAIPGPEKKFDPKAVRAFVTAHFEDPFWKEHALTCIGCGTCAFSCPICHCFDIVDAGPAAGNARVRTWDSCQFSTFTAHASGHNPRPVQPARQRQRILHKFAIYPEKFGEILCTGCGNCARNCPVGLGVLRVATEIDHG